MLLRCVMVQFYYVHALGFSSICWGAAVYLHRRPLLGRQQYPTPQGLVTSARVVRHKSQPVVPSVVVFVVPKDMDHWSSKGRSMVVEDLQTSEMGKKRRP